jgi:hypothetical protein
MVAAAEKAGTETPAVVPPPATTSGGGAKLAVNGGVCFTPDTNGVGLTAATPNAFPNKSRLQMIGNLLLVASGATPSVGSTSHPPPPSTDDCPRSVDFRSSQDCQITNGQWGESGGEKYWWRYSIAPSQRLWRFSYDPIALGHGCLCECNNQYQKIYAASFRLQPLQSGYCLQVALLPSPLAGTQPRSIEIWSPIPPSCPEFFP